LPTNNEYPLTNKTIYLNIQIRKYLRKAGDSMAMNYSLYEEKTELLKVLAHPVRLCIVKNLLEKGATNVSKMQN
jgi:hypothetical protein